MFAIAMFSLVMNANYALRKTFVFDLEEESDKQTDLMTFIKVIALALRVQPVMSRDEPYLWLPSP